MRASEYVITFGTHRGKTLSEVQAADPSYLRWVLQQCSRHQHMRVLIPVVRNFLRTQAAQPRLEKQGT